MTDQSRKSVVQSVVAYFLLAFVVCTIGCHTESSQHPISNIAELIQLNSHPRAPRMPVRFSAIITYYDPASRAIYLQDQTGGVCLDTGQKSFSQRAGESVEVTGFATGTGAPTILRLEEVGISPAGQFETPQPMDVKVGDAADGVLMANWVLVRGVVSYAGIRNNRLMLHLVANGDEVDAIVLSHGSDNLAHLVDAGVQVTGVVAPAGDFDPNHPRGQLLVAYPQYITKEYSAIEPFSLPVFPIGELSRLDPKSLSNRVHIQGKFLRAAASGDWLVQGADSQDKDTIRVQPAESATLETGRAVDVAGYLRSTGKGLILADSIVRIGNGGTMAPTSNQVLATISQVRALTPAEAPRALPVHLKQAIITYFDPIWQLMFVQDDTGASFVEIPSGLQPLQVGDVVSVDGVSSPGGFAPDITQPTIHFLRKGSLPKPDLPSTDDFLQGKEDSRWVRVSGVIRSVEVRADRMFFTLAHNQAVMKVHIPVPSAFPDPEGLVDSEVEVEGVSATAVNQKMQLTGLNLDCPGPAFVHILRTGNRDPFSVPVRTFDSLLRSWSEGFSGHRIHIQGRVTLQMPAGALYVKDKSGNIAVHLTRIARFQPGDQVDVVGFMSTEDGRPLLQDAVARENGTRVEPSAADVTPEQILKGDDDADLVQLQGMLLSRTGSADERVLVLQSGNQIFNASLSSPENNDAFMSVKDGSLIRLTGVVTMQMDNTTIPPKPKSFRILLRSPRDVVVLKDAPWWTLKHTAITVAILASIIIGIVLWVIALRKRVREQTDRLRQQMVKEAALEQQYKELFENASDIIYTHDLEGNFTSMNQAGERITGYKRQQILKMNIGALLTAASFEKINLSPAASCTEEICELELIAKDGHLVPIEASRRPLWREGQAVGMQTIAREITERKRAEAALLKAKSAAEDANRAKSSFLANMSHEIRTPLNGIIGMTELALDTELTPEQQEFLTTAKDSADSLLALINDILDFSKIEAGRLELDIISFDLRELVEETTRGLAIRAHQKKLELSHDIDPALPTYLMGDPLRLRQILNNLITNALKFTHVGEVVVQVAPEKIEGDQITLHFSVRDTGIGIAPEKQSLIFGAFSQADVSTTRQYGGTGLGLAITSKLVNIMSGSIWLESKLGKGSAFHITLPLRKAEAPVQVEEGNIDLAGIPVLIIDDNATNRRILAQTIKSWKMAPTSVDSGKAALQELEAAKSSRQSYALILLDCRMPEMDGFAVIEYLREHTELFDGTIMMLTSDDYAGNVQRCRELGIAAHLMKPVKQSELYATIREVLRVPAHLASTAEGVSSATPSRSATLRVLVAEDNLINQRLAMRLLAKHGHSAAIANNGKEAVEMHRQQSFDLILMDVQMPEMDGFTATEVIRRGEQGTTRHIPIVAMTAHAMKGDRERCLAAGMDGYLSKPINAEELLRLMASVTTGKESGGTNGDSSEEKTFAVIDETSLWERLGDDHELLADLAETFERQLPTTMGSIRGALSVGDAQGLSQAAHALKGCAANLSAEHTRSLAQQLEQLGKRGKLEGVANLVSQLEIELTNLRRALRDLLRKNKPKQAEAKADPDARLKNGPDGSQAGSVPEAAADGRGAAPGAPITGGKPGGKIKPKSVVAYASPRDKGRTPATQSASVIDPDELWNIVHGDLKLLREMVALFERDGPTLLEQVRCDIASGRAAAAQSSLHALKGTLMAFSASAALGATAILEAAVRENDLASAGQSVSNLEAEIERLKHVLKAMTYEDHHAGKQ